MSDHITIQCPACGKHSKLKAEFAGREVECTCGEIFSATAKKQKQYFVKRGKKSVGHLPGHKSKNSPMHTKFEPTTKSAPPGAAHGQMPELLSASPPRKNGLPA